MTINFHERKQNHKLLSILIVIFLGAISGLLSAFIGSYSLLLIPMIVYALFIWKATLNAKTATLLIILTIYVNFLRPFSIYNSLVIAIDFTVVILLCKHVVLNGLKESSTSKFILLILTMFCLVSLVEIFNPNIPEIKAGLEGFRKTFLAFLFFYVGIFSFKNKNEINLALIKISIFSIPVLLYGIKQYLFPSDFDLLYILANDADKYTGMLFGKTRSTSIFAGSFHLGIFSAILSMISYYLFKTQKNKLLFLVILLLALFSCYASLTRTNLLAITGALIFYGFYKLSLKKKIIFLPLIVTSLGLVWFVINRFKGVLMNSENDFYRMIFTILEFDNDTRFLGRAHGWEEVFTLIKLNPLGAYGTGSAGDTLQNNYDFTYHLTSHNFFFKIMMETGFFGLFLILIFFILLIIQLFNMKKNGDFEFTALTLSILVIFLINSVVGSTIETYPAAGLMMFIFGILFSNGIKNKYQLPKSES